MSKNNIVQGYEIYIDDSLVKVRGRITNEVEKEADEASSVLQYAVDRLAERGGGEVFLECGTFPLSHEVKLSSKISLRGSGRSTVLKVTKENSAGIGLFCKGCDGLVVSDLKVDGDRMNNPNSVAGIVFDDCGDSEIRNVYSLRFSKYGIWVRNNSFLCKVLGCTAADNQASNIYLEKLYHGGRGGDFVPNLVANSICCLGGNGIELNRVLVVNIVSCEVFQPKGHSYYIHDTSNSVIISGCRSFQAEKNAVLVESSHELNISSNIFCWHRGHGIELSNVTWGAINGNEVIDSGVRHDPPMIGIWLRNATRGVQVVGNTVFNWADQQPMRFGIVEESDCYKNMLMGNFINYYTETDIVSDGKNTLVEKNLSENRGFDPHHKGVILPIYTLWDSMGPFEKDKLPHKASHFTRDRIEKFLREY